MTRLEWLAKIGTDEAKLFLEETCPRLLDNGCCEGCEYMERPKECEVVCKATDGIRDWLFGEEGK